MIELLDTNPKTRLGQAKPGISSIPPIALLHCGRGMDDGKEKYGLMNWREHEVSASVYYNAAFRHIAAWYEGEQNAPDSGVHHLGHVMACCAILLDAEAQGKLNDDRPATPGNFGDVVAAMTRPFDDPEVPTDFAAFEAYCRADVDAALGLSEDPPAMSILNGQTEKEMVLKSDIAEGDYACVVQEYLFDCPRERVQERRARFDMFRAHVGTDVRAWPDQMQRTRIVFFIEVDSVLSGLSLPELDDLFEHLAREESERQ
ncbi:dATP/dGTP diphosphohydrolase domain-containing protein [Shimia sp.]|uniref:dATP/dGTP diphosphohydrolase domain-containing protein n=1 Tax=Shimia sp. TaxID=1954381 RepID=UPI003297EA84